ncbi:MAG TPA: hypothetical protein VIK59_05875 [Verrucomicrobiae bacterium]
MKLKKPIVVLNRGNKKNLTLLFGRIAFSFCLLNYSGESQSVIAPATPAEPVQTIDQQSEVNEFDVFPPENAQSSGVNEPFRWGPFIARPHLSYQFLYGTGIQSDPGNQHDTIINTISPGILFDLGRHWSLDYTPTLRFYSDNHFNNEFDNSVNLVGGTTYENWTLGLSQGFSSTSSPQVQTGTQTDQQNYSTTINASDAFNETFSLDISLNQELNYVDNSLGTNISNVNQDTKSWSTTEWLNYSVWSRLNFGIGGTAGYVNSKVGPDQTFEDANGRVNWRATDKISFQLNGGMEFVQFSGADESDLATPIFGASIQYQPFRNTQISLSGSRSVTPSSYYILDSVVEATSVSLSLNQRLLKKYSLGLNAGYTQTRYTQSIESIQLSNRTDDAETLGAQLSRSLWKRGTIAVTYQYSSNSSTALGFGYSSDQFGVQFSYNY